MTCDFHKHQITQPLTQLEKEGINYIKVDDFPWPWMEIMCCVDSGLGIKLCLCLATKQLGSARTVRCGFETRRLRMLGVCVAGNWGVNLGQFRCEEHQLFCCEKKA